MMQRIPSTGLSGITPSILRPTGPWLRSVVVRGDFGLALEQINNSLSTNAQDISALNLKAGICRKLGKYEKTLKIARSVLAEDPLNLHAAYEWHLAGKVSGSGEGDLLESLESSMTGDHEDYLELAVDYMNCGMYSDAIGVLERFRENHCTGEDRSHGLSITWASSMRRREILVHRLVFIARLPVCLPTTVSLSGWSR